MHARYTYGVASIKRAPLVTEIINKLEVAHLLDYGCEAGEPESAVEPVVRVAKADSPLVPGTLDTTGLQGLHPQSLAFICRFVMPSGI